MEKWSNLAPNVGQQYPDEGTYAHQPDSVAQPDHSSENFIFQDPWERPADDPISWKNPSNIKNYTQCMNQLDFLKCAPSQRTTTVNKSVYHLYGIPQDGSENKDIGMYSMYKGNLTNTSEQQALHGKLDTYCGQVAASCSQRFEVVGCTQPGATNYNPNANTDDGGCEFDASIDDDGIEEIITEDREEEVISSEKEGTTTAGLKEVPDIVWYALVGAVVLVIAQRRNII